MILTILGMAWLVLMLCIWILKSLITSARELKRFSEQLDLQLDEDYIQALEKLDKEYPGISA